MSSRTDDVNLRLPVTRHPGNLGMEESTLADNLLLEISALRFKKLSLDKENLAPSPGPKNAILVKWLYFLTESMGRIVPPFRQLYQETVSDLQTELKVVLVGLGHKSAFDLLLKEAWDPEVAAMGNSVNSMGIF